MERSTYIENMLDQYLLKRENYRELTQLEASNMMEDFSFELKEIIKYEHTNDLSDNEILFFNDFLVYE